FQVVPIFFHGWFLFFIGFSTRQPCGSAERKPPQNFNNLSDAAPISNHSQKVQIIHFHFIYFCVPIP
ncbi:MAG: hypothetical protein PHF70_01025, partial [Opitutales bacterium]|nr:hypothetical protein [Opitutales bacterium]